MRDLTQGSVRGHLLTMGAPLMIGMLVQTLYYMVDLYFVSGLGKEAVAGVSAAGNAVMIVIALTQILSVGTVGLIARAAGAKDQPQANLVFNQSLFLAFACTVGTLVAGLLAAPAYMRTLGANAAVVEAGTTYLQWYLPGLALQFAIAVPGSALRGTGIAKPTMVVQLATLGLNIVLAPILIAGWGTHHPLGVAGAGLASSLSAAIGVALMAAYFVRLEHFVGFALPLVRPHWATLRRMFALGLPAGGELFLMVLLNSATYTIIRDFGADAQAGFGIGARVMQALLMPTMAISFAVPAVAGQNFGGRLPQRVRETLRQALVLEMALMAVAFALCQAGAGVPVRWFTDDPQAAQVAVTLLHVISWNFFAVGIVFSCSGMFQALGNTLPAFASSATRLLTFVVPALWVSHRPGFRLLDVWHLSVASTFIQAAVSLLLVRSQLGKRLAGLDAAPAGAGGSSGAQAGGQPA
jgi:putative MATE family efflux protein